MPATRSIMFRLTKSQYERIINNAQAKGFKTISRYLRSLALENDMFIEKKVLETNRNVQEILDLLKKNKHKDTK